MAAAVQESTTLADGVKVRWASAGEGEPVVFIHGFSSDLHTWDATLGQLPSRRTIALDLPGHGLSDKPLAAYTATYYAQLLRRFLEVSGIGPASLVGLSLGGLVAARMAIDHPDWVTSLVLVDAAGIGRQPQTWRSRLQFLPLLLTQAAGISSRRVTERFLRALLPSLPSVTPELVDLSLKTQGQSRLASLLTGMTLMRPDARLHPLLHRVTVPTLIVWGEQDPVFPLDHAYDAAARIPGAQVAVVPGVGHGPNLERPREFNALLQRFFRSSQTPST